MKILQNGHTLGDPMLVVRSSSQFLMESLSPFEMTIRGYRDTLSTLQISEQRYRTLIDTAQDVIYTLAPDGTIKSLNPVFEQITGFSREAWIGKHFAALVHEAHLPFAMTIFKKVLSGETPPAFELRIKSVSGEYLVGEITTTPEIEKNTVIGTFGIARDITKRLETQEQLRALARRVVNAQEEERRRIARELHDDLCQWLSGMKLSLDLLEEKLPAHIRMRNKLRGLKRQVNQRIVEVRRMSVHLRPSALDDFGLVVSLSRLCEDYDRLKKTRVIFKANGPVREHYIPEADIALYRITQEALSNIIKHAHASRASVEISDDGTTVSLSVEDNGIGFETDAPRRVNEPGKHLGLVSMRERAMLLGGSFGIESHPDAGTRICVNMPLELLHI